MYHGFGRTRRFFEGWYFKCVSRDERTVWAIIPGVSLAADPAASHAFIQFNDASNRKAGYFRFPLSDFAAHPRRFDIRLGNCRFSPEGIHLDAQAEGRTLRGDLQFSAIRGWPVSLLSPGAMGRYAFVPSMECYHGILSFDHGLEGAFVLDGARADFSGGRGYIEKDWGVSFPAAWIWMQTNHFGKDGISLSGSVAKIPWRSRFFTGILFGFLYEGRVYRYATYTGAKVRDLRVDNEKIHIVLEDSRTCLEIEADRRDGADLASPMFGAMSSKVNETLKARIRTAFYEKNRGGRKLLFEGIGRNAGLEFVGDIRELINGLEKPSKRK